MSNEIECPRCGHDLNNVNEIIATKPNEVPSEDIPHVMKGIVYSCKFRDTIKFQCGCVRHNEIFEKLSNE